MKERHVPRLVAGVDEAGRGPVLGPLVVAAVATKDPDVLLGLGVGDSKTLSPGRRGQLAPLIAGVGQVSVVEISAAEIDERRQTTTLNAIEVGLFAAAIAGLAERPGRVTLDAADVDPARFGREVSAALPAGPGIEVISVHKADATDPVVGAASIIAKDIRDRRMRELSEAHGIDLGSGYPGDPKTRDFLRQALDRGDLPAFVRTSWDTIRKLRSERSMKTLADFT